MAAHRPSTTFGRPSRGDRAEHEEQEEVLALGRRRRRFRHVRRVEVGHPAQTVGTKLDHREGGWHPYVTSALTESKTLDSNFLKQFVTNCDIFPINVPISDYHLIQLQDVGK